MYAIFSTQKVQTLRCCRFGPRGPPGPDPVCSRCGGRLPAMGWLLKRDFVRVDVARRVVRSGDVIGCRGSARGRSPVGRASAAAAAVEELHVVGDDLGGAPLLSVLPFPRAGL